MVLRTISYVEMVQESAGIFLAFNTESKSLLLESLAGLDLALSPAHGLAGIRATASRAGVLLPKMVDANAAVHSTWRDKAGVHRISSHPDL